MQYKTARTAAAGAHRGGGITAVKTGACWVTVADVFTKDQFARTQDVTSTVGVRTAPAAFRTEANNSNRQPRCR